MRGESGDWLIFLRLARRSLQTTHPQKEKHAFIKLRRDESCSVSQRALILCLLRNYHFKWPEVQLWHFSVSCIRERGGGIADAYAFWAGFDFLKRVRYHLGCLVYCPGARQSFCESLGYPLCDKWRGKSSRTANFWQKSSSQNESQFAGKSRSNSSIGLDIEI